MLGQLPWFSLSKSVFRSIMFVCFFTSRGRRRCVSCTEKKRRQKTDKQQETELVCRLVSKLLSHPAFNYNNRPAPHGQSTPHFRCLIFVLKKLFFVFIFTLDINFKLHAPPEGCGTIKMIMRCLFTTEGF